MRIYIIGNDGITLCREAPATVNEGEIAVTSKEELHAAPLNGKRLAQASPGPDMVTLLAPVTNIRLTRQKSELDPENETGG